MVDSVHERQRVVLVTGPSGAGRTTAIRALEDMGYESIDNIPLSLIPRLTDGNAPLARPMALGIDVRNRDFSAEGLLELHARLRERSSLQVDLLYLDCQPDILSRRYSETRRRHPLAPHETPMDGILREMALLEGVRARADILVETSELTVHDLKAEMDKWFGLNSGHAMAVSVQSYSYKRGMPQGLDVAFDCRFLRNPHWDPALKPFTGMDPAVVDYIAQDTRHAPFHDHVLNLIKFMLPACVEEGKAHFTIGFGCTGGQHRSVAMTESVAAALAQEGWPVSIRHRELERRGLRSASDSSTVTGRKGAE
jgi:UPF0042 nucleotide-binding protein